MRTIEAGDMSAIIEGVSELAAALRVVGIDTLSIGNTKRTVNFDTSADAKIHPRALFEFKEQMNQLVYKLNAYHD